MSVTHISQSNWLFRTTI